MWLDGPYTKYDWFNPANPINRDNWLAPFLMFKEHIESDGGVCETQSYFINNRIQPDIVLFLDMPKRPVNELLREFGPAVRKWLFIQESEAIIPRNWDLRLHAQFEKIFTWNDAFVDDIKYFKLNYTHAFPSVIPKDTSDERKLFVLIAGHKKKAHPLELYSKREEAIRWFEANHPADFDLYGAGWADYVFQGPLPIRALNRIKFLRKLFAPYFPSYRGAVDRKLPVLSKYRFSICYENVKDMPGYITEKIFDSFFSGCIPVYWGANNITDHIPKHCFIDKRDFPDYPKLYQYAKNMPDSERSQYIANIEIFLNSEKSFPFSAGSFVKTLQRAIVS